LVESIALFSKKTLKPSAGCVGLCVKTVFDIPSRRNEYTVM
jgi:hypothetical protein